MAKVYANKRSIIHKGDGLQHIAAPPDVCKTSTPGGPIPTPYVNMAPSSALVGCKTVTIDGNPVANKSSHISTSSGDEPGALGGLISNKTKGKLTWTTCSPTVSAEGKGVVRFMDATQQNGNTYNTAFINNGDCAYFRATGLAYGDDADCPVETCSKKDDRAAHRMHEGVDAVELMDEFVKRLDKAFEKTLTIPPDSTWPATGPTQLTLLEITSLFYRAFKGDMTYSTDALLHLEDKVISPHLNDFPLPLSSRSNVVRGRRELRVPAWPRMLAIMICAHCDKKICAFSGQGTVPLAFQTAAKGLGLDVCSASIDAMASPLGDDINDQARSKLIGTNPRGELHTKWQCAGAKILADNYGHHFPTITERWYAQGTNRTTREITISVTDGKKGHKELLSNRLSDTKRAAAKAHLKISHADVAGLRAHMLKFRKKHLKILTALNEDPKPTIKYEHGDSVPPCDKCQAALPALLCPDKKRSCPKT